MKNHARSTKYERTIATALVVAAAAAVRLFTTLARTYVRGAVAATKRASLGRSLKRTADGGNDRCFKWVQPFGRTDGRTDQSQQREWSRTA